MSTIQGKMIECDRCARKRFFTVTDDPYMNNYYRINENDLCGECARDFKKMYEEFMSEKVIRE